MIRLGWICLMVVRFRLDMVGCVGLVGYIVMYFGLLVVTAVMFRIVVVVLMVGMLLWFVMGMDIVVFGYM